ncbi:ShlB/FhaC/HecB family hemolysin secretion/activation protein [Necropsobacter rosorum]|uniref:ShlB/FhaC/HecB family hemolysin secretion/activation protein n=1 Tax=Necropsobacter rosorum TaxID=908285 RepID=UPI000509B52C
MKITINKLTYALLCAGLGTAFSAHAVDDSLTQELQQLKNQQQFNQVNEGLKRAEQFLRRSDDGAPKRAAGQENENDSTAPRITSISIDLQGRNIPLDFSETIADYEGKPLTTKQVFELVKALTDVLYQAGYVTSAIGLKDAPSEGNLAFVVHWGLVNDYYVNGEQPQRFKDKAMVAVLPNLRDRIFNIYDIDQLVESLNTVNKSAKINVIADQKPAYSNLDIQVQRKRLPRLTVGLNNSGTGNNANGRNQATLNLAWSDLFGTNDSWNFSSGYRFYKDRKRNGQQNYALLYSQPFSFYTLDLKVSQADNEKELIGRHRYSSRGTVKTASAKLTRLLMRNRESILSAYTEVEFKKRRNYIGARRVNNYHHNKLTVGLSYITGLFNGQFYGDVSYANGLNWFHSDSLAYTRNGEKTLKSVSATLSWYKPLLFAERPFNYQIRFGAQYSPYSVYSDEQFSIGDEYTVRGFKGGISSGDKGYYLSQTLDMPFYPQKSYLTQIKPFLGIDFGRNYQRLPKRNETLAGFALGAKATIKNAAISFSYAKPIKNIKHNKNNHVYYVNASMTF